MNQIEYGVQGTPWWLSWNNTEHGEVDLVIPKAIRAEQVTPNAGDIWVEYSQIILLGFSYNVLCGAGPLGFEITSIDGDGTSRRILRVVHASAGIVADSCECHIPLSSSAAASPLAEGAKLHIAPVGALVTGDVLLWGIHTSGKSRQYPGVATPPYTFT